MSDEPLPLPIPPTSTGVTGVVGTASQVLADGTSAVTKTGVVTLSLPQSIATTSTPRFAAIGVGVAAGTNGTAKFAGSTSGAIEVSAGVSPASYTFTLPASAGTSGYVLGTDGAGVTSWKLPFGYQLYGDVKATNTNGGAFTSGAWRLRDLNTAITGNLDGVSTTVAANQVTIAAGTYMIRASAPAYATNRHMVRLYNVTAAAVAATGTSMYNVAGDGPESRSEVVYMATLAGATVFQLEHQCNTTAALGFGVACNFAGATELYATFEITKLA